MKLKRFIGFAAASAVIMLAFAACSKSNTGTVVMRSSASGERSSVASSASTTGTVELNLNIAHNQVSLDNPYAYGIIAFKEKIEQVSGGRIKATLFHGTLDENEDGLMQKMQDGQASIVVVSPSLITIPEVDVFSLEYLFDNFAHWSSCLDGSFGTELADLINQKTGNKFRILGYWSAGVRDYYGKKPVRTPADLKGMTIRISSSPVQQQFWKACGAVPKSVGWGALYQALLDNEVDSAENDYTNFSLKEHHKTPNGHYVCETDHDFTTRFMLIDGAFYDSLTPDQKNWLNQASEYATQVERQRTFEQLSSSKAKVIADGAVVVENKDIDIEAFKKLAYPIQDAYAKENNMERFIQLVREAK
ncbi:MAG: TRAP transporter substrate-binding protein [Bacteroides sp.]|nr:TRAP transporter substrate-binding protein [Prevotella sp.]MCM1406877.1 TRAP transporter substrate-binding protein [Treponema brennaborense]MCM1470028.1 TRAP transporter substrate-binding protein [Bacteroides sp.]